MKQHNPLSDEYGKLSTYAKWIGVHNANEWRQYHLANGYPNWVPKDPEIHFKDSGLWSDWEHFLDARH
ncbi:hypothetical protein [Paraferrimonas sedimenticola]|uniref:Uncharacterized protein n=1 Tax=Paraferrimonas sedimenticola TaxID=375674 RepID=A0AA37RWR8_9GAMM|nr:hypothetical protein [Paraferrimonas sedimenticola]GLP96152.1 hypothetical protein GCM10007895_14580 [Paraferrimonas sedimenticola]